MNNDACTRIKLRMAWCQSQSAQAGTEPELEGWRAEEAGLRDQVKIMVGGAPVDAEFAVRIGADGYGSNAPAGADLAKKLVGAA